MIKNFFYKFKGLFKLSEKENIKEVLEDLIEEAIREIEKALSLNRRMVKAEYDLGILYNRQGNKQKASEKVSTLFKRNNKLAKKLFYNKFRKN